MGIEFESKLMAAAKVQEEATNQKEASEVMRKDKQIETLTSQLEGKHREVALLKDEVKEIGAKMEVGDRKITEFTKQLETSNLENSKNKTNSEQLDMKISEQVAIISALQLENVKLKVENDNWTTEKVSYVY